MSDIRLKKITVEPSQSPLVIQNGDVLIKSTTPSSSTLDGALVINGGLSINNTQNSISSTSGGALTIGGGVGVMKTMYIGNDLLLESSSGVFDIRGLSESRFFVDTITNKKFYVAPDGVNKRFELTDTQLQINVTQVSSSSTDGALVINGGISISCTTDSSNGSNGGALTVAGGVSIGKTLNVVKNVVIGESDSNNNALKIRYTGVDQILLEDTNSNVASINMFGEDLIIGNNKDVYLETSTGSINMINDNQTIFTVYNNGTEFFETVYISQSTGSLDSSSGCFLIDGGQSIRNTTDATSFTSGGSFTTLGGMGVSKKLYVGDCIGIDLQNNQKSKLVLWDTNNDLSKEHSFSGFGIISSGSLVYQVKDTSSNHVFYSGLNSTSSDEIFKICGNRDIIFSGQNQKYLVRGGGLSNDSFSFESMTASSNICFFSANGLNSDNNDICIFAKATSSDVTNSEYLRIGWDTTDYVISSNKIGTGIVHNIKMECGIVDQFVLKNDGTISISSTSVSSCSSIGALVLTKGGLSIDCTENASSSSVGGAITVVGGVSIAKDTYIGGVLNLNNVELRSSITQNSYSSIVITSSDNKYPSVFLQGHSSVNSSVYPVEMRLYNLGNDDSINTEGLQIKTNDDLSGYNISTFYQGSGDNKTISLYTETNEDQIFLDVSGHVGINTSTPMYLLDVNGTMRVSDTIHFTNTISSFNASTASFIVDGGVNIMCSAEAESITRGGALTVAGGISIIKNMVVGGITTFLDTTPSTSSLEGAVVINGGLSIKSGENSVNALNGGGLTVAGGGAISGDLYVGGSINGSGSSSSTYAYLTLTATDESVNLSTGTLLCLGGLTLQAEANAINISNGGSILTPGGASIGKDVYIGGNVTYTNGITNYYTEDTNVINFYDSFNTKRFSIDRNRSSQILSISRYNSLGAEIEKSFEIFNSDGKTIFNNMTSSTDKDTASVIYKGGVSISNSSNSSSLYNGGGLTVAGGASIFKDTYIGGSVVIHSTKQSDDVSSGALIVSGGLGISGNMNVLGNALVIGNLTVRGQTTTVDTTNTTLKDNVFLLNSGPTGSSDSGIMIKRYQDDNDTGSGDVIADSYPPESYTLPDQTGMSLSQVKLGIDANGLNDYYNGWWLKISSGFSNNQTRKITSYNSVTKIATLSSPLTTQNPSIGDLVRLYNKPYVGIVYNETQDRFEFGSTIQDPNQTSILFTDRIPICFSSATSVSTNVSNSASSGGLVISGGIGISNTQDADSVTSGGTITTLGGVSVGKRMYVGTQLYVNGVNMTPSPYDVFSIRSFNASNNVTSFTNITDVSFGVDVFGVDIYLSAILTATTNLYVNFHIRGVNKATSWEIVKTYVGDDTGIQFDITPLGQLRYTTQNYDGFVSLLFKWRALVT